MNIHASYFGFGKMANPMYAIDKLLNPYRYGQLVTLRGNPLEIKWTARAERELQRMERPLFVEMQLYFSCVVKKRVLFHDNFDLESITVNENLDVVFRMVEATSCDPVEFAQNFPIKREYDSIGAIKVHPSLVRIDYKNGDWHGEFTI